MLASAALVLACVAVTAPPTAAAGSPSLSAVTLDPGPFTVAGLNGTASVHVSVSVHIPGGLRPCLDDPRHSGVRARLERWGQGTWPWPSVVVPLQRTAGNDVDGTWEGTWRAASTRGGTWTFVEVSWSCGAGAGSRDPRDSPGVTRTVAIAGTNVPRITVSRVPAVARWGTRQLIRFRYASSSGRALVEIPVLVASDNRCGADGVGGSFRRTDSLGRISLWYDPTTVRCVMLTRPASTSPEGQAVTVVQDRTVLVPRFGYRFVSARWTKVPRATPGVFEVSGVIAPARGRYAVQLLVGRTWRSQYCCMRVRPNGHYGSTVAAPTGTSWWRVRVVDEGMAPFATPRQRIVAP